MIGKDNDEEEVHYKVADRRKFNSDGSVREGVTLDPAKVQAPPQKPVASAAEPEREQDSPTEAEFDADSDGIDDSDIPGANDPASFINFLSMLATNAATALGAVPNPATGQRHLDLETGKYWIDVLAMIREKTVNNLHPKESHLLEGLLGDMRMQYVQLVRATEEKLKAKAAQNLTGADILGKK